MNTKPNSFVGLLGVDQGVLILKRGNDIEESEVFSEQEKFNKLEDSSNQDYKNFENAIIITNIESEYKLKKKPLKENDFYYSFNRPFPSPLPVFLFSSQSFGSAASLGSLGLNADNNVREPVTTSRPASSPPAPAKKPIEVRKVFPETWMFDSIQMAAK